MTSRSYRSGARTSRSRCLPGQPQLQAQGQVVPIVWAPGHVAPAVVPGQPQPPAQAQVVAVVPAQALVAPGVAPGQPQPPINQPQGQRQVPQAAHPMQGQGIPAPQNAPPVAGSPQAPLLLDTPLSSAGSSSGGSQANSPANSPAKSPGNSPQTALQTAQQTAHLTPHLTAHLTDLCRHHSYLISR